MERARNWQILIIVALLIAGSTAISARMNPSILMIYGGTLSQPVFVVHRTDADRVTYLNFWCGHSGSVESRQLADRPYFNVAIFWGLTIDDTLLGTLRPEQAHQHGRLYVGTNEVGAAVVTTDYMTLRDGHPLPRSIPREPREFIYGAWLTPGDIEIAEKLGVHIRKR